MGFNDYGRTPNVWRPSEVPYPSGKDQVAIVPGTDEVDDSRRLPLGWYLVYDLWDTQPDGFCTRSTSYVTAADEIPIPRAPVVCIIAHLIASATTANQSAEVAIYPQDGGALYPPFSNYPLNQATLITAGAPPHRMTFVSRFAPLLSPREFLFDSECWALLHENGLLNSGYFGGIIGQNAIGTTSTNPFDSDPIKLRCSLRIYPATTGGSGTFGLTRLRVWSCWPPNTA